MRFWFRNFAAVAASVATLAAASPAVADPSVVGSASDASGIDGLDVNGVDYSVTFSITQLSSPFSEGVYPTAEAAANLVAALNSLDVTGFNFGVSLQSVTQIDVDNTLGDGDVAITYNPSNDIPAGSWVTGNLDVINLGLYNNYVYTIAADFTQVDTSVPEPSTLSLFGAALLSFAGFAMYRRRKQSGADLAA
jgi:hypothetical protein